MSLAKQQGLGGGGGLLLGMGAGLSLARGAWPGQGAGLSLLMEGVGSHPPLPPQALVRQRLVPVVLGALFPVLSAAPPPGRVDPEDEDEDAEDPDGGLGLQTPKHAAAQVSPTARLPLSQRTAGVRDGRSSRDWGWGWVWGALEMGPSLGAGLGEAGGIGFLGAVPGWIGQSLYSP